MKKILSIGNLFVKRIGLVAILLATIGVGDVWAAAETTLKVTKSPTSGAGNATVATSETGTYAATQNQASGGYFTPTGTHTYWLKAETTSTAWLWKGWYSDGTLKLAALSGSTTVKDDKLIGGVTKTYTATWVQPKVTGTTAGENGGTNIKLYTFGEYTDPTIDSETKSIVFTLENNDAGLIAKDGSQPENYYTEALTGSWTATTFVKESHTYAKGNQNYTYNVSYKLSGVHATNITANIKLTSKYGGSNYTAKLNATENYTPYFNYAYTEYNYTPDDPLAEGQFLTQIFNVSKNCYAANNGVWSISLPADAAAKGFTLQTAADNPNATVQFEALPGINKADLTTTLTAVCTYTDASEAKVTYTQTILLSGDAGKVITIDGAEVNTMTFDIDYAASGESTQTLPFETTLTGLTTTPSNLPAGDFITYTTWTTGLTEVAATVKHNLTPGQYTPSIKYSYNSDEVYSILNIVANIRLAKPVVTTTVGIGLGVQLAWHEVYGATSYIVKSGETVVATIEDPAITTFLVDNIGGRLLVMGTEYPFTVTAVYEPNAFGNRTSDEIRATPSLPTTVSADNISALELYTGTEKPGAYPYHKDGKRLVDLSAAFKDGVAAFDQLFIFGLTTGDASNNITVPTATTNSNAVTPCYIYKKSGDNYVLDQTIENVNVATKPSAFNITASGQKIYFTGYAPYASCGSTWEENGVFYIKGSNNIDIYLNDFELYARHKTDVGNYPKTKTFEVTETNVTSYLGMDEFELDMTIIPFKFNSINVYSQGSGAAFCFYPNTNNFCANVHLSGENVLQSARGMDVHVNVSVGLNMDNTADQHSAPIQITHDKNSKSRSTTLTIDDKWISGERTNGVLDLARIDYRPAPTIDLGNEKTTLIFDGGQIFLSNSFNTSSTYSVSYAISYRYYSIKDGMAKMYGLGSDQPGGKVLFKDGTIECKPLSDAVINASETAKAIFKNLFHNASSMKCPANTKIDGGTFNCDILACNSSTSKGGSPTNSNGSPLCMVDVPVKSQLSNGLVETLVDNWMDYAATKGANTNNLGYYGIQSMTPEQITDENGDPLLVVHMMLPSNNICFKEEITKHWVMCYPQLSITTNQGLEAGGELGGDKEVPFSIQTDDDTKLVTIKKTSKFLFASMDDITINAVSTYSAPGNSTDIELLDGGNPANIINEEEYVIYDKVYMLMPLVANEWKLFSPPFDISNVYVIESYPENKLIDDFSNGATDKKGKPIITGDKIAEAREAQSHRMLDMLYHWIWENDATGGNSDVWSNRKGYPAMGHFYSVGTFMQYWYDMYDTSYRPVIEQLYHYKSNNEGYPTGMSRWDANFYLYEVDGESWVIDENGLQTSWKEVPTISTPRDIKGTNKVIMQKGHVYSMSFPYTIVNSQKHDPSTVWDYWTGKYILLEGYPSAEATIDSDGDGKLDSRGQKIAGSNAMSDIMTEYTEEGKAVVRGNYTFSSDEVSSENIFVINGSNENEYQTAYDHNVFVNYPTAWLYPAECFVYANAPAAPSSMPRRIASINPQSGEITYRDETTTSTPTIAGNNQMFVYNIAGGVGIVPVVEQQVSIYNAAGQLVTSEYLTDEVHIPLPSGIYFIAGAKEQYKVVVK